MLSYRLKRVCGSVYNNGNIIFTPDGNSAISPIGNRFTVFDLVHHTSITFPFENSKNIRTLAISPNGLFLLSIDIDGQALLINFPRRIILQQLHFKKVVTDVKFSPDNKYFAITYGNSVQIWKTPSIDQEYSPLVLHRSYGGFTDDTTCLDWSSDSMSLIVGSKDLHCRTYYRAVTNKVVSVLLSGHRDIVLGCYYGRDDNEAYSISRNGTVLIWNYSVDDTNTTDKGILYQINKRQKYHQKHNKLHTSEKSWKLIETKLLWDSNNENSDVSTTAYNKTTSLLLIGFINGVFGLYEMPTCVNLHRLSISQSSISTCNINNNGQWLVLGSIALGQLLIWEWQSETYILKQQGHLYGLNALDYSNDGHIIATGGEDGKIKLWSTSSGFCIVTFSEHIAPITAVRFIGLGSGKAVISSSLDGTVRAHDLVRYKNFKTLTTPTPVQFTSLGVDMSGEIVCAGALDPFNIYVWALQTGQLLDILSGHEGPIACLDFSRTSTSTILASGSWDGTLKLWNIYSNTNTETMEHGCDVLALAFRPDNKEIATCCINGNIYFWDIETGEQIRCIEGRRDISGGRLSTDAMTAKNSSRNKCFTCITYSSDGSFVLAGGRSKYTCIYSTHTGNLVKKFQLSRNKSLEGILDELPSDRLVDGVQLDNININTDKLVSYRKTKDQTNNNINSKLFDGSRLTKPELITSSIRYSPSGREWAAATTQGLQIFSIDETLIFAPSDLDITITPQTIATALAKQEYSHAINMSLHLKDIDILKKSIDSIPIDSISLVVKSIDIRMLTYLLNFLAEEILQSRHLEYYLLWCWELLQTYANILQSDSMPYLESLRSLIRSITIHENEIMKLCDENNLKLLFLRNQLNLSNNNNVIDNNEMNDN